MSLSITKQEQLPFINFFIKKNTDEIIINNYEKTELENALFLAKLELESDEANFNFVDDDLLIEYYTFKRKADELKYRYILKQLRDIEFKNHLV